MPSKLRPLAVTITESPSHAFRWELVELTSTDAWTLVERAPRTHRKYHRAMAAGLLALQAMTPDLDLGPREPDTPDEPDHPSTSQRQHEDAGAKPRNAFGFGFGLPKYGNSNEE